jgi:hypothetical protein
MASRKASQISTGLGKHKAPEICGVPEGLHPSQVSGMFQDDPTFEEFCEILRQQRTADYQQAQETLTLSLWSKVENVFCCIDSKADTTEKPL